MAVDRNSSGPSRELSHALLLTVRFTVVGAARIDRAEPTLDQGSSEECLAAIKNMLSQLDDDDREQVIGELSRMVNEGDFGEDEPPPNGTTSTRNDDGSISSPVKTETPMMLGRGAEDRALRSYATRFPGAVARRCG